MERKTKSNGSGWVNGVGTLKESKNKRLYIEIDQDISLKKGDRLSLKKKSDAINEQAEKGLITEERRDELLKKLSFIKYELSLTPRGE